MKVKINEIRKTCENFLVSKCKMKKDIANIIFADFLEGELLGKKTHGLAAFVSGVYDINRLKNSSDPKKIIIKKNQKAYALIDGGKQAGQLVAQLAKKILIKKAKQFGIAMVGTYKTQAILRPGSQAEEIAKHNLIGIVFHNGGAPLVAPFGGIDPVISTDPIGFAIPTTCEPIVADMAISVKAWREVEFSKLLNKNLPLNSFLDKKGNIATDPDKAYSALPFGDYKGYILGILFEILTGSLVNSGFGIKNFLNKKWKQRGALYLAIDPSKFVNLNKFKKENTQLIKELKKSRKRTTIKEILIPGERAYKNKAKCLKRGWLDVDKTVMEKINKLCLN
ncbi:MAG: Ldh family oxidoreductase [Candidatus Magasanikiibacteriota bacterium]